MCLNLIGSLASIQLRAQCGIGLEREQRQVGLGGGEEEQLPRQIFNHACDAGKWLDFFSLLWVVEVLTLSAPESGIFRTFANSLKPISPPAVAPASAMRASVISSRLRPPKFRFVMACFISPASMLPDPSSSIDRKTYRVFVEWSTHEFTALGSTPVSILYLHITTLPGIPPLDYSNMIRPPWSSNVD